MPTREWRELSRAARQQLSHALSDRPYKKRILEKIDNANAFGIMERYRNFFRHISLPVGEVEFDAIRSRNHFAHGGTLGDKSGRQEISRADALRTLIHRVMLKLIDWQDTYIDYSTLGHPSRGLAEPLGGPKGDGAPYPDE